MWRYAGPNDPTRVHPKDVDEEIVEQWLRCITGARDNPQGRDGPPLARGTNANQGATHISE